MITVTLGQGLLNTQGFRMELEDVSDFFEIDAELSKDEVEPWISGHVWRDDRRLISNWECAGVLFVDADFYSEAHFEHDFTTETARVELQAVGLLCSGWHHTPRGFRAWFQLDRDLTDAVLYHEALEAAQRTINSALEVGGILGKAGVFAGYAADAATLDLARWMYRPNCVVGGRERRTPIFRGPRAVWTVQEVLRLGSGATQSARTILGAMPHSGQGDGSLALIRVCRRALSLGVQSFAEFLEASKDWNVRAGWSNEELERRWTDASAKWLAEGVVTIPTTDKGKPIYGLDVLELILEGDRRYRGRFRRNLLDQTVLFGSRGFVDEDATELRIDLKKRYAISAQKEDTFDVVRAVATRNGFSPVADWLNTLRWDGVDRISKIVDEVLHIEPACRELAEVYLRRWGIGAVHRARRQGVKMDNVLLLVGGQGIGKSSFFRVIAGETWFSDTFVDLSGKDGLLQLLGTWIYELSELEAVYKRADVARVRAVLSSVEDRYRAPYDRTVKTHPRRVVFVGTSNSFDVLQDPDGSRRFWGLEVPEVVSVGLLAELREGFWAQVVAMADAGEQHWLTRTEDALRAGHNARFERDQPEIDRASVAIAKLDREVLTVSDVLRAMGWGQGGAPLGLQGAVSTALVRAGYRRIMGGNWQRAK